MLLLDLIQHTSGPELYTTIARKYRILNLVHVRMTKSFWGWSTAFGVTASTGDWISLVVLMSRLTQGQGAGEFG